MQYSRAFGVCSVVPVLALVFLAISANTLCQEAWSAEAINLLDKYISAGTWSNRVSLSMHSRFDQTWRDFQDSVILSRTGDYQITFHRQGAKAQWQGRHIWEASRGPGAQPGSEEIFWLVDGTRWFRMRNRYERWSGSMTRQGQPPQDPNAIVNVEEYGGFCYGYGAYTGDEIVHLGQFLKKSPDVRIAGEEVVAGTRCRRVEAKTPYGVFTVWIAPEKGYNALRVRQVVADPADRWQGESLAESPLVSFFYEADSLEFRESDGVFLPVSGQTHVKFVIKDRYKGQRPDHHIREHTTTVTYDQIDLNPDFAALGAFRLALPDGTRVQDMDHPGVTYEIIGGELQGYVDANTIAAIETEIDELRPESNSKDLNEPNDVTIPHTETPAEGAPAPRVSVEALREAVLANEAKAALIRMEYRVTHEESGGPPPTPEQIEAGIATHSHSVYAQDGARFHHTTSDYADAKWLRGWINVVDGEVHKRSILPDLMWGRIARIETFNWANVCPTWLGFLPFDKYRLTELLVPTHASVQEDCVTVEGRQATVVKIGYPGKDFYALVWMDIERGMPLRIERHYPNKEGGGYHRGWLVEGIKLHRLPNGGWIPVQGIGRQHIKRPEFELHNVLHVVVDVNSISIDRKDIPTSLFDIQFPPGAEVENGIVGGVVPGDLHLESLSREVLQRMAL